MAKLKTEIDTPKMQSRIERAWNASAYSRIDMRYQFDFEHGQWWVTELESGRQWSVVDAEGGQSIDGFDFERV